MYFIKIFRILILPFIVSMNDLFLNIANLQKLNKFEFILINLVYLEKLDLKIQILIKQFVLYKNI